MKPNLVINITKDNNLFFIYPEAQNAYLNNSLSQVKVVAFVIFS
jgi:hypothetical protein